MKKVYLYFIAFMIVLSFSSCTISEVNEKAIIEGVLVEKSGMDEQEGRYKYTFALPLYEEEQVTQEYISVYGDSFSEAFEKLENAAAKKPFAGQNKYMIFSEDLKKGESKYILEDIASNYQWRKDCVFFFADKKAMEFITEGEYSSGYIEDFAKIYSRNHRNIAVGLFKAEKSAKEDIYNYLFPVFTANENSLIEKDFETV